MATQTLECRQCGAALSLPVTARFVTCVHCGAHLAVHRLPGASLIESLEILEARAGAATRPLGILELQREIQHLDLAWNLHCERAGRAAGDTRLDSSPAAAAYQREREDFVRRMA